MKKTVLILFALSLAIGSINAQVEKPRKRLDVGVAGGINLNRMEFQPGIRQKLLSGWNGGVNIRYTSEKYFSMICATQLEVNFSQRGLKEDFNDGTKNSYSRLINYIEVPLFAHVSWGKEERGFQFFLNLGPQFGFFLNEKESYIGDWSPEERKRPIYGKKLQNRFDYGIAGGIGIEWKTRAGNFILEGRYYYALGDIFKNSKTDDYGRSACNTIYVRLGYSVTIFNK